MRKIQNTNFMDVAIDLSAKSGNMKKPAGGPFGAVIVRDGKIVGRGYNRVLRDNDPTAHGEIVAIRDACKKLKTNDLSGCDLYTSCKPCPMCLAAARWANISNIFYAADDRDAEKIGFRDSVMYKEFKKPNTGTKIKSAVARAAAVMRDWRKKFWKEIY